MLGIIAGTGFYDPMFLGGMKEIDIDTSHGIVYALHGEEYLYIPRHGRDRNTPPHMINHKANMLALQEQGVEEIISITSVGSLKREIPPRSIVIPHDFIQLTGIPTFFNEDVVHVTPSLDNALRERLISAAKKLKIKVRTSGIYLQTTGPRLETRAEIDLYKNYADLIGMTMASEATLANELGIKYATISSVDNYANGVIEEKINYEKIVKAASSSREDVKRILKEAVEGSA